MVNSLSVTLLSGEQLLECSAADIGYGDIREDAWDGIFCSVIVVKSESFDIGCVVFWEYDSVLSQDEE